MPDKLASRTAAKGGQKLVDMGDGRIVDFTGWDDDKIENFSRNEKPTQFEKDRTGSQKGFLGTVSDRISQFGAGIKAAWNKPQPKTVKEYIDQTDAPRKQAMVDDAARQKAGRSLGYRTAAMIGQSTGVADPVTSEKAADVGDSGGVLGSAAVDAAPVIAAEGMRGVPATAKAARPLAARMAPAAGAATGYAVGGWPGLILGREAGQGLKSVLTPTAEASPAVAAPFEGATSTASPRGNAPLPPVPATPQAPMTLGNRVAARTAPPPSTGATRVPVPREPMPGDPNLMGSVPRPDLPDMATRGVPGAADQQRLLGEPIVYTPPEGYPPPRSVTNLSERVPQPEQPNLTQRAAAPPDRRVGPNGYRGPERRAGVQDWQNAIESTPEGQPTPGEDLSTRMRTARAGAGGALDESKARIQIMRDPVAYAKFRTAELAGDTKTVSDMLVKAQRTQ